MKNNKRYTPEFKTKVILEILKDKNMIKDIVNEYEITYSTLRGWKKEVINRMPELLGRKLEVDIQLKEIKNENKKVRHRLDKINLELDFLKRKRFLIKLLKKSGRI